MKKSLTSFEYNSWVTMSTPYKTGTNYRYAAVDVEDVKEDVTNSDISLLIDGYFRMTLHAVESRIVIGCASNHCRLLQEVDV